MLREMEFDSELPKHLHYCSVGAAALGAAGTIGGALFAGNAQQNSAQMGIDQQGKMYKRIRADLSPYRMAGRQDLNYLQNNLKYFTSPIKMDEDALRKTPGYQFNLTQGLKSVQNSAAARGLGVSGAALKGASTFATGLADNTYQTQFNMENINRTNAFNRLKSLTDLGESAAAQTGTSGTQLAGNMLQGYGYMGNAQAAMYNGIGGGINNLSGFMMAQGMYGGGNGGNGLQSPTGAWA